MKFDAITLKLDLKMVRIIVPINLGSIWLCCVLSEFEGEDERMMRE